jgi:replicative DNA helicase
MTSSIVAALNKNKLVAQYGIPYLDKELKGIFQNELVLIGARSGAGKTTLANSIALNNSHLDGVVLFSLENFEGDLMMFETFKEYKKLTMYRNITFRDFCMGDPDDAYQAAANVAEEKLKRISVIYRQPHGFDISDMAKHFTEKARAGAKLIIIDHVDYFDLHKPKENENTNISEIMKAIRELQDIYNIPVVLISHLRKGIRETVIPTLEDFIGTSNKVKEATTVILFAPDDEKNSDHTRAATAWSKKRTWICIRKDRMNGYNSHACNINFDCKELKYEEQYALYHVNYWGTKAVQLSEQERAMYEMRT